MSQRSFPPGVLAALGLPRAISVAALFGILHEVRAQSALSKLCCERGYLKLLARSDLSPNQKDMSVLVLEPAYQKPLALVLPD